MTSIAIRLDTHRLFTNLKAKGFQEDQADSIVTAIRESNEAVESAVARVFEDYKSNIKDDLIHLETRIVLKMGAITVAALGFLKIAGHFF